LHAAALLARLVGIENAYARLEELRADLDATRDRPTSVNWLRLLVYVGVETFLTFTGVMYLPMLLLLTKKRDPQIDDGCAAFNALGVLVIGLFYSLMLCPPLAVAIAVAMRGGFSFYLTDMALVTRDGRRAPRWRCGLRAILTWLQLIIVTVLFGVAMAMLWGRIPFPIHQSWGAVLLYLLLLGFALVGETLLAWLPGRSIADRLSGTYLVPK
jgi:hypothetical protein